MQQLDRNDRIDFFQSDIFKKLQLKPGSKYEFFWDVVTASYMFNVEPSSMAYMLSTMPNINPDAKDLSQSFAGIYSSMLNSYADIVELFVPVFYSETEPSKVHIWGSKTVWMMADYPKTPEAWTNSVGSRTTDTLVEVLRDKQAL